MARRAIVAINVAVVVLVTVAAISVGIGRATRRPPSRPEGAGSFPPDVRLRWASRPSDSRTAGRSPGDGLWELDLLEDPSNAGASQPLGDLADPAQMARNATILQRLTSRLGRSPRVTIVVGPDATRGDLAPLEPLLAAGEVGPVLVVVDRSMVRPNGARP